MNLSHKTSHKSHTMSNDNDAIKTGKIIGNVLDGMVNILDMINKERENKTISNIVNITKGIKTVYKNKKNENNSNNNRQESNNGSSTNNSKQNHKKQMKNIYPKSTTACLYYKDYIKKEVKCPFLLKGFCKFNSNTCIYKH